MIEHPNAGRREWSREAPRPPELARLGMTGIEVEDADGVRSYDPNSIAVDVLGRDMTLGLKPIPGRTSVCSGEPAVLYRTEEAEVALTPAELHRFVARALTSAEFTAICEAVGALYEMHGCFYDETGEALQPKV